MDKYIYRIMIIKGNKIYGLATCAYFSNAVKSFWKKQNKKQQQAKQELLNKWCEKIKYLSGGDKQ